MKKKLLIIIPAYNEEGSIGKFLSQLISSDELPILVISHPYNLGYGTALQTGYKYGVYNDYQYLIQMDSDGQHDICNIPNIYACLKSHKAPDLVIGSRFLKESQSFPISLKKRLAIHFFRKAVKLASKQEISDPTSGLQGLTRSVFEYYAQVGNFDNNYPDANMLVQMALLECKIRNKFIDVHHVFQHLQCIYPKQKTYACKTNFRQRWDSF